MTSKQLLSFDEGLKRIINLATPLAEEIIPIDLANGRVLRKKAIAQRAQPAADMSAMDGYALNGAHERYKIIGEIAAGNSSELTLSEGQAVRIFTGALIPNGTDRILIQENAKISKEFVAPESLPSSGQHIRKQGSDFKEGFCLNPPLLLNPHHIALIAAMNIAKIEVTQKPRIAIFANGNELKQPGSPLLSHQIPASNSYALKALIEERGGIADIIDILPDNLEAMIEAFKSTHNYDMIVSSGGASVGDHDFTKEALTKAGFVLDVHKIALRPGKPILAGKRDNQIFLGLPGNPVSALITARLFLVPLLKKLSGLDVQSPTKKFAILKENIAANGDRTHFMRAEINLESGEIRAFLRQDSALLSILSLSNALIWREPFAPIAEKGETVPYILLA